MDGTLESKKSKPKTALESMFQKKFKAMETSPALPNAPLKGDDNGYGDGDGDGHEESSSSPSQDSVGSQAIEMGLENLNEDNRGQLVKSDRIVKTEYNACLAMCVQCLRFCLRQGLDWSAKESDWEWDTSDEGIFVELFKLIAIYNEDFELAISESALEYYKITNLQVQKNLVHACAKETIKRIVQDIGDDYFGILVDGSYDRLQEDHLSVFLRYVDKRGMVIERFLGVARVEGFTPVSCKAAIDSLLVEHSLSPCKIRGQSYNGASDLAGNFDGDIHDLKTLIMKDYRSAYYLHCFAHRLQFTMTTAAEKSSDCTCWLFMKLAELLSLVKVSCARNEMLQEVQAQKVLEALGACELESGRYMNTDYCLERTYDSHWEYDHFKALVHVVTMFPVIIEVLDMVAEISRMEYRVKAVRVLDYLESFEFVFLAHFMIDILGFTDVLNCAMLKRDQVGIANIISLVKVLKELLQRMRSDQEWELLLNKVSSFCSVNDIEVPDMNANYDPVQRKGFKSITNLDHFRDEVYYKVIDQQLEELSNQFDEVNMELLSCMACLNPSNCFSSFDKRKLIRLAEFYPGEFSASDLMTLEYQLDNFILDMRTDDRFQNLKVLDELSVKLVETRKHDVYVNVYMLLKLMLILPVTTPSIERSLSAMDYVKYKLQHNVGDQLLYDSLAPFVERELFSQVVDDDIISCFKAMKTSEE